MAKRSDDDDSETFAVSAADVARIVGAVRDRDICDFEGALVANLIGNSDGQDDEWMVLYAMSQEIFWRRIKHRAAELELTASR